MANEKKRKLKLSEPEIIEKDISEITEELDSNNHNDEETYLPVMSCCSCYS